MRYSTSSCAIFVFTGGSKEIYESNVYDLFIFDTFYYAFFRNNYADKLISCYECGFDAVGKRNLPCLEKTNRYFVGNLSVENYRYLIICSTEFIGHLTTNGFIEKSSSGSGDPLVIRLNTSRK